MSLRIFLASIVDKFRGFHEHPLERLQEIGIKEGMTFLDVGCTLGFYSFPASQLVRNSGLVYALDINQECLDRIEKKARQKGINNIETIKADACQTGLPDAALTQFFFTSFFMR